MANIPILLSWREVLPLKPQSLVVLDIDETFLWFPTITEEWWKNLVYTLRLTHGTETAHRLAREEWRRVVSIELPKQTDQDGFKELNDAIRDTKSKLIFLTARAESIAPLTRKHLTDCGVSADVEVHFSCNKGETLRAIAARNPENKEIVCVDDKMSNLYDVLYHNPNAKVYLWIDPKTA